MFFCLPHCHKGRCRWQELCSLWRREPHQPRREDTCKAKISENQSEDFFEYLQNSHCSKPKACDEAITWVDHSEGGCERRGKKATAVSLTIRFSNQILPKPGNNCPRDANRPGAKSADELPNNWTAQRVDTNLRKSLSIFLNVSSLQRKPANFRQQQLLLYCPQVQTSG